MSTGSKPDFDNRVDAKSIAGKCKILSHSTSSASSLMHVNTFRAKGFVQKTVSQGSKVVPCSTASSSRYNSSNEDDRKNRTASSFRTAKQGLGSTGTVRLNRLHSPQGDGSSNSNSIPQTQHVKLPNQESPPSDYDLSSILLQGPGPYRVLKFSVAENLKRGVLPPKKDLPIEKPNERVKIENERIHPAYKFNREEKFQAPPSELTRGPRSCNKCTASDSFDLMFQMDRYNQSDFETEYEHAKFYIIKSFSEDNIHKSIKYGVWASTPSGTRKLDLGFLGAESIENETGKRCPVFLFFSVNGSGQFVGLAAMVGKVDYNKDMDFWKADKWSGFFPVDWKIVKDVPNSKLWQIILENNDNRPVTFTRDTQEVPLKEGLEMLTIFKSYEAKTSLLDDFKFYEERDKCFKSRSKNKAAIARKEEIYYSGDDYFSDSGSLIKPTKDLCLC